MIIGLTGGLATGKTTVSRIFKSLGAYVINADKIVHRLIDKTARKKIGGFIFDEPSSLKKLCRMLHPIVKKEIFSEIKNNKHKKLIVIDAPLLIETGLDKKCDFLIVVKSNLRNQLARATRSLAISKNHALKRIKLQMPLRKKIAAADFIIDNNGSLSDTKKQVTELWYKLMSGKYSKDILRGVKTFDSRK